MVFSSSVHGILYGRSMARVSLPHWGDNDQEMVVVWLHECQKPVESIRGGDKLSQLIVFYVDRPIDRSTCDRQSSTKCWSISPQMTNEEEFRRRIDIKYANYYWWIIPIGKFVFWHNRILMSSTNWQRLLQLQLQFCTRVLLICKWASAAAGDDDDDLRVSEWV